MTSAGQRAFAARVAVDAEVATTVLEIDGGVLVSTPDLPVIWDLNQALLRPGADAALLTSTIAAAGPDTMRITLFDPAGPVPSTRGWTVERSLLMIAGDEAVAWPEGVESVAADVLSGARRLAWEEDRLGPMEQLFAMVDRFSAFPGSQTVAAADEHEWAGWAVVANGCIDDVWVQPWHRGKGLGRAVTQAALAAGGWFLWTAADDPVPQGLYRTLGMHEAGTVVQLTRQPE